ncbi:FadR/GntR family transcriptional regulator [Rhizobacter sp. Root404]|uniref:FadR/GntR family transcriptional regulator n=1 Tax=Rhizobacter sp. Root404 TaxID=1736528 RepID=UPI0006FEE97C|nr:FCD domain-containing protein [Rhizobacter sp. Root404]KQW35627.1 GntR family transcriptional regulator [Rhizobacter sp. Root404]
MDSAVALREAILENLRSRQWRAGHRIPTERELSGQFGLSRSAVRRVLADMKDKRLIVQTVGSGTYVSDEVNEALAAAASSVGQLPTSPAELMSARAVLEPAIVAMVVGNATSLDFARMNECCDKGEAAKTLEQFEHWDAQLHEAIADAAHNSFISKVFRLMNQVREQGEWGALKRRSATPERRREYQSEHRALVAALQDRDGARATALCLAHLDHVRRNLLGF